MAEVLVHMVDRNGLDDVLGMETKEVLESSRAVCEDVHVRKERNVDGLASVQYADLLLREP